ncbi:MAG: GspE/PulE family protein [Candidatus Saccharimonas sp.]
MRISDETLTRVLKGNNLVTDAQLAAFQEEATRSSRSLQDMVLEGKLLTEESLTKYYAEYSDIPFINLKPNDVSKEDLNKLSERIARQYNAVVFKVEENGRVHLAMNDPDDVQAVNFIEKEVGSNLVTYLAPRQNILDCLESYRGDVNEELNQVIDVQREESIANAPVTAEEVAEDSPIAQTVNLLLEYAIRSHASDIHIEPRENVVQIRYRIDGVLKEVNQLPRNVLGPLVSRIKISSNLKIDEHRVPQDGRFKIKIAGKQYALRVSTLPIADGEKVVMRILDESNQAVTLEDLGYWGYSRDTLKEAMTQPDGMILVTGPTGSGKSTSLFSVLSILNKPNVNISTVEDPVEYKIIGVNQTQTNPQAGMTFANGLRALLRQDPNIIMVGEVRDSETANLAIQAALTGHLVFSTLHTNNAATSLPRLLDMDIEPFLIASTIKAVVGQRLIRRLCHTCRVQYTPDQTEIDKIIKLFNFRAGQDFSYVRKLEALSKEQGIGGDTPIGTSEATITLVWKAKPEGCPDCNGTGYRGRMGIYEVLSNSHNIQKMIMSEADSSQIQDEAIAEGMSTMQTDGLIKMLRGETTLEEVLRVTRE